MLCRITAATSGDLHSTPSIFNGDAHDDDDDDDGDDHDHDHDHDLPKGQDLYVTPHCQEGQSHCPRFGPRVRRRPTAE